MYPRWLTYFTNSPQARKAAKERGGERAMAYHTGKKGKRDAK